MRVLWVGADGAEDAEGGERLRLLRRGGWCEQLEDWWHGAGGDGEILIARMAAYQECHRPRSLKAMLGGRICRGDQLHEWANRARLANGVTRVGGSLGHAAQQAKRHRLDPRRPPTYRAFRQGRHAAGLGHGGGGDGGAVARLAEFDQIGE